MGERLRVGALLGASTLTTAAAQVIRAKIVAVALGLEGTGLIAQVTALQGALLALSPVFSGAALLTLLARARVHDRIGPEAAIASGRGIALVLMASAAVVVTILVIATIGLQIIGSLLVIGSVGSVAGALLLVEQARLQDDRRFTRLAVTSATGALLGVALTGVLTIGHGVAGAAAGISLGLLLTWLMTIDLSDRQSRFARVDPRDWTAMVRIGAGGIVGGAIALLGQAALRWMALVELGPAGAGLVYAVSVIPAQLSVLAVSTLVTYAGPRVTEAAARGDIAGIRQEITTLQRLGLAPAALGFIIVALFARPAMTTLFSDAFLPVAALLPIQLAGELFRIQSWLTGTYLLPAGHRRVYVVIEITIITMMLAVAYTFSSVLGVTAFVIAHFVSAVAGAAIVSTHARRRLGLSLRTPIPALALGTLALLIVAAAPLASIVLGAVLAGITLQTHPRFRRWRVGT